MNIHTQHGAGDCDVCAAQVEADAAGAIPPVGHERESLLVLANKIAEAIRIDDQRTIHVTSLLLAFAAEIKREAIEP